MRRSLTELFDSPDLLPMTIDLERRRVNFAEMSASKYAESSFLDERSVPPGEWFSVDLDHLVAHVLSTPFVGDRSVHYVLHTAFCRSTFLSRCLDRYPRAFVLREPRFLADLALKYPDRTDSTTPSAQQTRERRYVVDMALRLIARRYQENDIVIVKLNDLCNVIGRALVEDDPANRFIFLSMPLRDFLVTVLKSTTRRAWVRERIRIFEEMKLLPQPAVADSQRWSDAQAAGCLWMFYQSLGKDLIAKTPARSLALDGQQLLDDGSALGMAAAFFGLSSPAGPRDILSAVAQEDAKAPGVPFEAGVRDADLLSAQGRFGAEADAGVAWAQEFRALF